MSNIESRLAKLEELTKHRNAGDRLPGVSAEAMEEIRRVAAVCPNWQRFADYLKTLVPADDQKVVGIEDMRRADAVRAAFARSVFEESEADMAA